ncbi:MAG: phage tail sheath C-terminal domain-containing protein [Pseudomonadota bacterium]
MDCFEPNDDVLWTALRSAITALLSGLWREGAFAGKKMEEAFFVSVGHEAMTADDIAQGRLIVEIGIAPVRPAEFVSVKDVQNLKEVS